MATTKAGPHPGSCPGIPLAGQRADLEASAWTTARSVQGSAPTSRPVSSRPSPKRTRYLVLIADHMGVGEQKAIRCEQDTGTGTFASSPGRRVN